ncbi:MAG TPA: SpoIIE family protein phosphatase [Polyangiaceae bacterium]|nr:SpoIIE family protein phosphatase [Polyangiaceae bacterium]
MNAPPPPRGRLASLEARLMAVTSVVLVLASTTLFLRLAARERSNLIAAKASAATMVIELLATELAAAIDFGDADDVSARLNALRANPDIVSAAVWPNSNEPPTASWSAPDAPALSAPLPRDGDGTTSTPGWLIATKTVVGPRGASLARVRVAFTLRGENEAYRKNRLQLFWMTAGLTAATAILLGALARRYVTGPLRGLAEAASALADGDLTARVDIRSADEIGDLARAFNVMGKAVAFRQERLEREVELAQRIQTSILPRQPSVPGLSCAATMIPTAEVGGDYYDFLPVEGGCWIGIGDVSGHGLDAGLMMLMTQSIVASLVAKEPAASPRDVVCVLNEVLFDNIRNRLRRDDHATLTLLRYDRGGRVVFAGAHEEIIVYRAAQGTCETIATPGTWVGGRRDIRRGTVESSFQLGPGDVMLLHTDGATEIRNGHGEEFGIERLGAELQRSHDRPAAEIVENLVFAVGGWGTVEDDVTLLVFKCEGSS